MAPSLQEYLPAYTAENAYCSALDINSQQGDPRFPWQRDVAVQCDLKTLSLSSSLTHASAATRSSSSEGRLGSLRKPTTFAAASRGGDFNSGTWSDPQAAASGTTSWTPTPPPRKSATASCPPPCTRKVGERACTCRITCRPCPTVRKEARRPRSEVARAPRRPRPGLRRPRARRRRRRRGVPARPSAARCVSSGRRQTQRPTRWTRMCRVRRLRSAPPRLRPRSCRGLEAPRPGRPWRRPPPPPQPTPRLSARATSTSSRCRDCWTCP
ncbi:unnamed protein product [Ixodes pacificus]